jgi:hypothetical protein
VVYANHIERSYIAQLREDINGLQQQIAALTSTMHSFIDNQTRRAGGTRSPPSPRLASPAYTATADHKSKEPVQPKFIGHTRSAFSFNIAETSMTRMGISNIESSRTGTSSQSTSRGSTPELETRPRSLSLSASEDPLMRISVDEAIRLVGIYEDEIQSVHPIIETNDLIKIVPQILHFAKTAGQVSTKTSSCDEKDVFMLRIAIATAVLCESHGRNEVSDRLVIAVKEGVGRISNDKELVIRDIQIMGMLVRPSILDRNDH